MFYLVGLGNPGEEYEATRHNVGRMVVENFAKKYGFDEFVADKKTQSLKTEGVFAKASTDAKALVDKSAGKEKIICLLPETYMNKSGSALKNIITSKKSAEKLIVVHDELDIALGKFKVSFGKNSAGHKGVDSVIRAIKTKEFWRVRVGITPASPTGKLKKPKGEKMLDFLTKNFKKDEIIVIKKVIRDVIPAIESSITNSH